MNGRSPVGMFLGYLGILLFVLFCFVGAYTVGGWVWSLA